MRRMTNYDAMGHRTILGKHHCGTNVYSGDGLAEAEGIIRTDTEKGDLNRIVVG